MTNQNPAKNPYTHLITVSLIILIILLAIGLNGQFTKTTKELYESKRATDSLKRELQLTSKQRDSLFHRSDSLNTVSEDLTTKLVDTKAELRNLRGKYDKWNNDSLANEMNRRAKQ